MLGPCPGLALSGDGAAGGGGRTAHAPSGAEGGWGLPRPSPVSPAGLNSPGERPGDSRGRAEPAGVGGGKRRSWAARSVDWAQSAGFHVFPVSVRADEVDVDGTVEDDLGKSREGSRTDDEVVQRLVPGAPWFWEGQFEHQ